MSRRTREVTVRDTESRDKAMVLAGGVALLGSVLVPIRQNWRAKPRDGFPLSYYPMFSAKRSGTVPSYTLSAWTRRASAGS